MAALEGEQDEDSKEQGLRVNGWGSWSGGAVSLRLLWRSLGGPPVAARLGAAAHHPSTLPSAGAQDAAQVCDFTVYAIFQSAHEVCQWNSPGYGGRTPHWECTFTDNPLPLPALC